MKKTVLLLAVGSILLFTSCQNTKEVTLEADGSGTYTSTADMSSMLGMAKMSIPADKMDSMNVGRAIDTTVAMDKLADMLEDLTSAERDKIRKGMLGLTLDMKEEKFITRISFPFSNVSDISDLDRLSGKIITDFIKKQMSNKDKAGEMPMGGMEGLGDKLGEDMPNTSIDEYYVINFSNGVFERKLNSEKYNAMPEDEKEARKQMAGMGMGSNTLIVNLPKPVKKTEGKNITVSEDKKKVTIESSAEDFMDIPKDLEFKIEY
jgi:hypothetical protein